MLETNLWKKIKIPLSRIGKFQKISDRFTSGVPDIIGCWKSVGVAIELKGLSGSRILKANFRPGQLNWLKSWSDNGGVSVIICTHKTTIGIHHYRSGSFMESGMSPDWFKEDSLFLFRKTKYNTWYDFILGVEKAFKNYEN